MGQDSSAQISSYRSSPPTTARFMVQLMYVMYVNSRYYCNEGPVGAIVLLLAAVSPDVAYTHIC